MKMTNGNGNACLRSLLNYPFTLFRYFLASRSTILQIVTCLRLSKKMFMFTRPSAPSAARNTVVVIRLRRAARLRLQSLLQTI